MTTGLELIETEELLKELGSRSQTMIAIVNGLPGQDIITIQKGKPIDQHLCYVLLGGQLAAYITKPAIDPV